MLNINNAVMTVMESSGTLPLTVSEIRRRLLKRGIEISACRLGGYLRALDDLNKVAYISVSELQGGYMSITAYWRLTSKKYHGVKKQQEMKIQDDK